MLMSLRIASAPALTNPIGVETEWIRSDVLKITALVVSLDGSESVEGSLVLRWTVDVNVLENCFRTSLDQSCRYFLS
jgi:hypothetical protein